MTRTKRFFGSVFLGYTQQVAVIIVGLWLTPFLLHRIGQHDYGLWLVGLQIMTWLTLMDFGVVALLPRETAYAVGRASNVESAHDLPAVIAQTWRVVLWQWPLVALAALCLCFFLPSASQGTVRGPLALVVGSFTLAFPLRVFRAVLEGLQDLVFLGRLQIVCWAIGTLLSLYLVILDFHLYALAIGWAVAQLSTAFGCFFRLRLQFPYLFRWRSSSQRRNTLSSHLGGGFWISLGQVAQLLLGASDLLVVGKILGSAAVVSYSCTGKLITVLSNQPTMLMHSATPGLSAIKSSGDKDRAFQVVMSLTQGMLILSGAVVCVVLAVNRGFVGWWVGPQQFGGVLLTAALALAMLIRHWNTTAIYSIFCFGYERRISITSLADGAVSIIFSIVLVRKLGALGSPLGSILSASLISLPANLRALSKESGKSTLSALHPLFRWLWRFIVLAAATEVFSNFWTPRSPLEIATTAFAVVLIYGLVILPMVVESPLAAYLPRRVLSQWKKLTSASISPAC